MILTNEVNKSNKLIFQEAHDHQGVPHDHQADSFAAIDLDGDKQITSEEMAAYITKFNDDGAEVCVCVCVLVLFAEKFCLPKYFVG